MPESKICQRCNTPVKCSAYGCSPNTWPAELTPTIKDALEEAKKQLEEWEMDLEGEWGCGRSVAELEASGKRNPAILKVQQALLYLDSKPLLEYDPNIQWARHTVSLTFMQWDYSKTVEVEVGGNTKGFSIISAALFNCFENLYEEANNPEDLNTKPTGIWAAIFLTRPAKDGQGEDELEVDLENVEDLEDICVSASIVKHTMEER